MEAELARAALAQAGIEAVLADENVNGLGPGFAPGGARLLVPEEEAERAEAILAGQSEEVAPLPEDFVPPEAPPEPPSLLGDFFNIKRLVIAAVCLLAALLLLWALRTLLPLHWTHDARELVQMGIGAAKEGDYPGALRFFDAALKLEPRNFSFYQSRGWTFYNQKNDPAALEDFNRALEINPTSPQSYAWRAWVFRRMGRDNDAINDFTQAIHFDPQDFRTYTARAYLHARIGNVPAAIADNKRAIALAPDKPRAYNNLAWIYATWPEANLRNGARAVKLATKACELSGWSEFFTIGTLAAAEAETGQFKKAIRYEEQALELARQDPSLDPKTQEMMTAALAGFRKGKPYRNPRGEQARY